MSTSGTRPLLSASLIVKDEEAMLPRCLDALRGVVDEVVVLDTGSTDRTVEIAESMGAVVHRGTWDDDFGRARNEALSHCRGRWVIYVDADEQLVVPDVATFRADLQRTAADAFRVRIDNVEDHGGAITFTHDPVRLFRRSRFSFEGRIHEHVVARSAGATVVQSTGASITHFGYVPDVVAAKDKVARNVRLAQAAWDAAPDDVQARVELARSLSSTTRFAETMDHLRALRALGGDVEHTALHLGVKVLLHMGEPDEAVAWAEEIRHHGTPTINGAKLHGEALFRLGRYDEALQVLEEAPAAAQRAGVHGTHETTAAIDALRVRTLLILGREAEAADLGVAIAATAMDSLWPPLITVLVKRGELERVVQPFLDGLDQLGEVRAKGVLAALSLEQVELGDAFCEVLAGHPRGLPYALAFVLANADRLSSDRACAWSAVARTAGLEGSCPLVRQMSSLYLPPAQRLVAAALALGTFADPAGRTGIADAAAALDDEEMTEALYVVSELAPDGLVALVTGYVTTQRRALVLARALVALGAHEEAIAVLHHGLDDCAYHADHTQEITAQLHQLQATA